MRAAGQRMRRRRQRVEMNFLLSFTSMTDMFTNVLLFLLFFVNPSTIEDANFALPKSVASAPVVDGPRVRIARDSISVDGQPVAVLRDAVWAREGGTGSTDDLVRTLAAVRERLPPSQTPATVLVECDETVPWSTLAPVLEAAKKSGFEAYKLVVQGAG